MYNPTRVRSHDARPFEFAATRVRVRLPSHARKYLCVRMCRGSWIRCADIARVAYLFLHGGVYLDTDMYVDVASWARDCWWAEGCERVDAPLPPHLCASQRRCRRTTPHVAGCFLCRQLGPVRLPEDVLTCSDGAMYIPCDDDGIVQNNFIAAPPLHPFLLWLLKVTFGGTCHRRGAPTHSHSTLLCVVHGVNTSIVMGCAP